MARAPPDLFGMREMKTRRSGMGIASASIHCPNKPPRFTKAGFGEAGPPSESDPIRPRGGLLPELDGGGADIVRRKANVQVDEVLRAGERVRSVLGHGLQGDAQLDVVAAFPLPEGALPSPLGRRAGLLGLRAPVEAGDKTSEFRLRRLLASGQPDAASRPLSRLGRAWRTCAQGPGTIGPRRCPSPVSTRH